MDSPSSNRFPKTEAMTPAQFAARCVGQLRISAEGVLSDLHWIDDGKGWRNGPTGAVVATDEEFKAQVAAEIVKLVFSK